MEIKKSITNGLEKVFTKRSKKKEIDAQNDMKKNNDNINIEGESRLEKIRKEEAIRSGRKRKEEDAIGGSGSAEIEKNKKKAEIIVGDDNILVDGEKEETKIMIPVELMKEAISEINDARKKIVAYRELIDKYEKENKQLKNTEKSLEEAKSETDKYKEETKKLRNSVKFWQKNFDKNKEVKEKLEKENLSRKLIDTMVDITGDMFDAKQRMRTSKNIINKHERYVEREVEDDIARHEAGSPLVQIEIEQYLDKLSKILEILKVEQQSFTEKKTTFNKQKQMLIDNQKLCSPSRLTQLEHFLESTPVYEKKEVKDSEKKLDEFIHRCEKNKEILEEILKNYKTRGKSKEVILAEKIYSADYTNSLDDDKIENTKEKFAKVFPDAAKKYPAIIEDLAKVAHIFMDRKYCDGILKDLQEQMVSKIRKKGKAPLQDVLIDYFRNKHKFNEYKELVGLVGKDEFMRYLEDGHPLLDLGAGPVHGWASHLLQTYLMCKACDDNKLTHEPLTIYKALGEGEFAHKKSNFATMWNFIFDNNASADILYGDPGIRSALGIPDDIPNIRKDYMQGYIGPVNLQDNIINKDFPDGPLKEQLTLTYLQMEHFDPNIVLSEEKLKESIAHGIARAEEEYSEKEIEIRALKENLSDVEVRIKYPGIEELSKYWKQIDSSKKDSSELEERYANVQRKLELKVPTRYFLNNDYLVAKKKILDDNEIPGIIKYKRLPGAQQ